MKNEKMNTEIKDTLKVIVKIVIPIVTLYAIICVAYNIYVNYFTNWNLSPREKLALEVVEDYKNMLKNPKSMQLSGDILVIFYENEETEETELFTYFTTYATNSFNAVVLSNTVYCFTDYLGDIDNLAEEARNTENEDKRQKILDASVAYALYKYKLARYNVDKNNLNPVEEPEYTLVNGEWAAKKLKIDYIK